MAPTSSHRRLRVGVVTPTLNFDPHDPSDYATSTLNEQLFERLFHKLPDTKDYRPLIAGSPLLSIPGKSGSYTTTIRDGLKFSDGSPVTLDSVVSSLRHSKTLDENIRVGTDSDALLVEVDHLDPNLVVPFSNPWCGIAKRSDTDGRWVGTGPYRVTPESTPQRVLLERNPHYHGTPAPIAEIEFITFEQAADGSSNALASAMENGEIDFTNQLSRDDTARLGSFRKHFQPGHSVGILWINSQRITSVPLRKALRYAIDRYRITSNNYANPASYVAHCVLPRRMSSYRDDHRHEPSQARELLTLHGSELRSPLKLLTVWGPRPYLPNPDKVAEELERQLAEYGIKLQVQKPRDAHEFQAFIREGDYDLALTGWNADTDDPVDFLHALFASSMVPESDKEFAAGSNDARYRSDELDRALVEYRSFPSSRTQEHVLTLVDKAQVMVPLQYGVVSMVLSWDIVGFHPEARGIPRFEQWHWKA